MIVRSFVYNYSILYCIHNSDTVHCTFRCNEVHRNTGEGDVFTPIEGVEALQGNRH